MIVRCISCNKANRFQNTRGAKLANYSCIECGGTLERCGGSVPVVGPNPFAEKETYISEFTIGEYYVAEKNSKGEVFYLHEGYFRKIENPVIAKEATVPYKQGWDCEINGANTTNCHPMMFATPQLTADWEMGKAMAKNMRNDMLYSDKYIGPAIIGFHLSGADTKAINAVFPGLDTAEIEVIIFNYLNTIYEPVKTKKPSSAGTKNQAPNS